MKTFNTIYNTPKNENMINESLGTFLLGLFAVFGITLYAAVKGCSRLFRSTPEDPEDPQDPKNPKIPGTYPNSPIERPSKEDLAKIDEKLKGMEPGTKETLDKTMDAIDGENPDKDKNKDKDKKIDPDNKPEDDSKKDDGEFKFEGQDPRDGAVFQKYWSAVILSKFQDTLNNKELRKQLEAIYNWVIDNNGDNALQEFIKDNKDYKKNNDMAYVLAECFMKVCCELIQIDTKYHTYFEDEISISIMLKIILLQIFISSSISKPNIFANPPQDFLASVDSIISKK